MILKIFFQKTLKYKKTGKFPAVDTYLPY